MPLSCKFGGLIFRCSCRDSHRSLVCDDCVAVSMLFDPALKVPDDERAGQVKGRVQEKLTNPFNADKAKKKRETEEKKKRETEEKEEAAKPLWAPVIERGDAELEDSVAGLAAKAKTPRRRLEVSAPCLVAQQHLSDGEVHR